MRDLGSIPGLGRFPGEENGNPLQYSCLENPMDGGAWCRLLSRGYKESGTTERLHFHFFTFTRLLVLKSLVNFHSCPENPMNSMNSMCSEVKSLSCVRLFATPWTVAHQAPLSMGFSRQDYWSGLPFSPLGDLPDPGIKSGSPALQGDSSLLSKPPGKPNKII